MQKISPNAEECLELLARYAEAGKRPRVKDLAGDLGVSPASVSEMLGKLSSRGYVRYESYGTIALTAEGERIGRSVLRKHRLIERFLMLTGIRRDKIHKEACALEHALSDEAERGFRRAVEMLGKKSKGVARLIDLKAGEKAEILQVEGGSNVRRRLTDMGLTPGTVISMARPSSRMGPVEISVRSSTLAIGRGIAEKILVKARK